MPRNASGTYSLPAGNPVEPNTVIETEWANSTMEDIGNEITNSLSRTGEGGMLAPLRFYDGTFGVPGIAWLTETSSGLYRAGAGEFWATVLATPVAQFTTNGLLLPNTVSLTVQGNQTIGGTLGVTGAITASGGVTGNITTSSATITGGTINGTAIGGSTPAAGAFTTLSASGAFSLTGDQVQVTEGGTGATTASGARTNLGLVIGTDIPSPTGTGASGTWSINVSGNAGTVTNGVYTSGSYSNPSWITALAGSKITGDISGNAAGLTATLAIASGGTGATTAATARSNLLPSYSTNALKFLRVNAGGTDVEWASEPSLGTVTSVAASGGSTGLTFSGSPITTSGTLTLGGTLALASGGTGATTAAGARTALDVPSTSGSGATGTWGVDISGNAATVTNGVYTSGSYSNPAWITALAGSKITGNISGNAGGLSATLAVGSGGTGQTSYTDGQLLIGNSTGNTLTKATLTAGSGISITNGGGSITIASTSSGGTVTSVDVSGGTTGLTTSGGPVTGSGTITLAGTLAVANGGTGVTSSTGSGSNVLSTSPTLVTPLLGTPTSGTLTNCTGLPISTGVSGLGTSVATALGVAVGSAGAFVVNGGALGTPSSGTLTNATGLPISTGVSGLATGVATFLATPSSANLRTAVTDETGSGSLVFATSPTLVTPVLGTPTSGTLTNCTGLPLSTGITGTLAVANGGTGVTSSTGTGNVVLSASPTLTGTLTAAAANFSDVMVIQKNSSSLLALDLYNNYASGGSATTSLHIGYTASSFYGWRMTNTNDPTATNAGTLAFQRGTGAAWSDVLSLSNAGGITLNGALTYGGVTLSNSVTGTGSMVLSAGPTLTGTLNGAAATFSGAVVAGGGSQNGSAKVTSNGGTGDGFAAVQSGTATGYCFVTVASATGGGVYQHALFQAGGVTNGSITSNGTTTTYGTSSDARLKDNIADANDAGAIIDALKVRQWDWKSNGTHEAFGFIAQEEHEVYSPAVVVGDDGDEITRQWSRDDSKLVPLLVKEVQSLRARVAALEN